MASPTISVRPRVGPTELEFWWQSSPASQWIAVGTVDSTPTIFYSAGGTTWTNESIASVISGDVSKIIYANDTYFICGTGTTTIAYSYDGHEWTPSNGSQFFSPCFTIEFGKNANGADLWIGSGLGVTIGDVTTNISYSLNGIDWLQNTDETMTNTPPLIQLKYGKNEDGTYIWVGSGVSNSNIFTSTNGLSWTSNGAPFSFSNIENGTDAYGIPIWVAGSPIDTGAGNGLYFSRNGTDWEPVSANSGGFISGSHSIAFGKDVAGNPMWLAGSIAGGKAGGDVALMSSSDGITWVPMAFPIPEEARDITISKLYYNTGVWVAVGNSDIFYSTNGGETWSLSSISSTIENMTIASITATSAVTNNYVLSTVAAFLAYRSSATADGVYYSPDGISWNISEAATAFFAGISINDFAYGRNMWVAARGNSNLIAYSTNGLEWASATIFEHSATSCNSVAYGDGVWVAACNSLDADNNCLIISNDAKTWRLPATNPVTNGSSECKVVRYGGDNWVVAISDQAESEVRLTYSTDGDTWTDTSGGVFPGGVCNDIAFGNGKWIAVGTQFALNGETPLMLSSSNGIDWSVTTGPYSGIGQYNTITYGKDGSGADLWTCTAWLANGFIAFPVMAHSPDGVTWTDDVSGGIAIGGLASSLTYLNGTWVCTTNGDTASIYSTDGYTWTELPDAIALSIASSSVPAVFLPGSSRGAIIRGLETNTDYQYMIQGYGESYSDPVFFRKVRTSAPAQPVDSVTVVPTVTDSLSLTFSWTVSATDYAYFFAYELRVVRAPSEIVYAGTRDISASSITFSGLDPSRGYIFHIQRGNDAGYSAKKTVTIAATTIDPLSIPGIALWLDATDPSVSPVADGAAITSWKNKAGNNNAESSKPVIVKTDSLGRYLEFKKSSFSINDTTWEPNQYFTLFVVDMPAYFNTTTLIGSVGNDILIRYYNGDDNTGRISVKVAGNTVTPEAVVSGAPVNIWSFSNYGGLNTYLNNALVKLGSTEVFRATSSLQLSDTLAPYTGKFREVLMYKGIMSDENRATVMKYLFTKWMPPPSKIAGLPVKNGLILWLDSTDPKTLFSDLSGATPAIFNSDLDPVPVQLWKDKSGYNNNVTMNSAADLVAYDFYGNGTNVIPLLNTSTSDTTVQTEPILVSDDVTLFMVLVNEFYVGGPVGYTFEHGGLALSVLDGNQVNPISWGLNSNKNNNQYVVPQGVPYIFYGTMKKRQLFNATFLDHTQTATREYTIEKGLPGVRYANISLATSSWPQYYGEIIYYNRVLSDDEILKTATYLTNKWKPLLDTGGTGLPYIPVNPAVTPFLPTSLPKLKVWLDSSDPYSVFKQGDKLTEWKDRRDSSISAVATGSPLVKNGIVLNGDRQYMKLPDGSLPTGPYSYYIVADVKGDTTIINAGSHDVSGTMWVAASQVGGYSFDGIHWASAPFPFPSSIALNITDMIFAGGYWVAVTSFGSDSTSLAYSSNGFSWTMLQTQGTTLSVATDGKRVVIAGSPKPGVLHSSLMYSDDPKSGWNIGSYADTNDIFDTAYSVAYGNGRWYASGYNGSRVILTSTDGINWELSAGISDLITDLTINPIKCIAYGLSGSASNSHLWLAVGQPGPGSLLYEGVGTGWVARASLDSIFSLATKIAYGYGIWVAGGAGPNTMAYSTDGTTWQPSPSGNSCILGSCMMLKHSNGFWIASGETDNAGGSVMAYSKDGMEWQPIESGAVFNGGTGAVRGAAAKPAIHNSSMSIHTTTVQPTYVAIGVKNTGDNRSYVAYSSDGITWKPSSSGASLLNTSIYDPLHALAYGDGQWLAITQGTASAYSYDGNTWYDAGTLPSAMYAVAYGQGMFVVAGRYFLLDNGYAEGIRNIHYRRPGDSGFSTSNTMTIDTVQSLAYGNGIWVAGGFYAWGAHRSGTYASNLAYSYDGITWFESANGNSVFPLDGGTCECLAYGKDTSGNDRWLAGGSVTGGAAMAYSSDGNHWTPLTPVIFSTRCAVIAYADGLWVAGGQGDNTMAYSLNGIIWFPSSSGNSIFTYSCNVLSYSNGKWTADGPTSTGSNLSAYSTDGIIWTQIIRDGETRIKAIVPTSVKPTLITQTIFDNNATDKIRVAGMRNTSTNNIIVSRDGSTWMSAYTTNSNNMNGIGFNGSQWIAVGAAPQGTPGMLISNDGYNWGAYYLPSMTEAYGIAWNGSYWIAVGGGSTVCIAKSIDGYVWDIIDNIFNKTNDVNPQGRAVAWNGSYWIVVGSQANPTDGSARVGCVFKSFDGINWTPGTGIPTSVGQINTVTWMGDHWLIGSDKSSIGDTIYKSYDGIAWGPLEYGTIGTGLFSRCTGITWNGSTWVAVGYAIFEVIDEPEQHVGRITTWDGANAWISQPNPFTWEVAGISWDGKQFVAVGSYISDISSGAFSSCIATSPDGITWTRVGENINYGVVSCIANGSTSTLKKSIINDTIPISDPVVADKRSINVLAYGVGGIAYSKDGITWTKALVNPFIGGSVNGIAFNGFWVAVGVDHDSNCLIATSTDGSTWVPTLTQPFDETISSVAWNGEYWLAGGKGTAKSMDGITWIDASSNGGNNIDLIQTVTSIVWNGKYWLAAGNSPYLSTSPDGIHWAIASNIIGVMVITGLAWSGSTWLAVGYKSDMTGVAYVTPDVIGQLWQSVGSSLPFNTGIASDYAKGVTWNGSVFMAVGRRDSLMPSGGRLSIAISPDGITWTDPFALVENNLFFTSTTSVSWNGTYWILAGNGGDRCSAISYDGFTWTRGQITDELMAQGGIVVSGSIEVPSSNTCIIESINGSSYISGQPGNNSVPSRLLQDTSNNYIGWDTKDKYMKGTIKEILVYDTGHTDRERRQIEAYLTNKWTKPAFDPTTIDASAVLWLDSSSDSNFTFSSANRVSVWKDKMGLCDLSQNALWAQPVYSLDPVTDKYGVQFGGRGFANGLTNAVAPLGDTESLDYSIFVAQRYDYSASSGQNVATTAYSLDIGEPPFNVGTTSLNQTGLQGELRFSVGYKSGPGIGAAIRNDIFAIVDVRKAAVITSQVTNDSAQTFYYNGKSTDTGSFYWSLSPNATLRLGYDGILTPDLSGHMRGYIYEMLIFRGPVSFSDREKIEGYLAWKWGAAGSLPRSHPYTLAPPIPPAPVPTPLILDGPSYNMARTLKYDRNFILAWNPVPNATGYRVCFAPKKSRSKIFSPTELEDPPNVRFKNGSTPQPFLSSSNIITDTHYLFNLETNTGLSVFVFSYNGTVRGRFPKFRAYITPSYLKVYETIRTKLNGGTTFATATSVTYTNLNTGETVTRTRAAILASGDTELMLGGNIVSKTF